MQIPWYLIWVKHLTYNKVSLEQLNLKYKVCTILFKMISAPSLFTSYLFMQLPLQSPPKISSNAAGTFAVLYHLPTCYFVSLSLQFPPKLPIYLRHFSPPYFYIQPSLQSPLKIVSPTSTIETIQAVPKNQWTSESCVDWHWISTCFPKAWTGKAALTTNYFLLFILSKFVYFG